MILKNNNGVTLIELMIVLVIAAILVGGIYTLFTNQQRSYFVQDRVAGIQQDARAALGIMARDIRMAGLWTGAGSGTGFFGVGAIGGSNYAVDPGNGAQSDTMPQVLSRLDLPIFEINASIQGQFVARDTETEGVLVDLQQAKGQPQDPEGSDREVLSPTFIFPIIKPPSIFAY